MKYTHKYNKNKKRLFRKTKKINKNKRHKGSKKGGMLPRRETPRSTSGTFTSERFSTEQGKRAVAESARKTVKPKPTIQKLTERDKKIIKLSDEIKALRKETYNTIPNKLKELEKSGMQFTDTYRNLQESKKAGVDHLTNLTQTVKGLKDRTINPSNQWVDRAHRWATAKAKVTVPLTEEARANRDRVFRHFFTNPKHRESSKQLAKNY